MVLKRDEGTAPSLSRLPVAMGDHQVKCYNKICWFIIPLLHACQYTNSRNTMAEDTALEFWLIRRGGRQIPASPTSKLVVQTVTNTRDPTEPIALNRRKSHLML